MGLAWPPSLPLLPCSWGPLAFSLGLVLRMAPVPWQLPTAAPTPPCRALGLLAPGILRGGPARRTFLSLSPQALHDLGLGLLSALHVLTPWRYALKRIGGQFGSSVLSYFLFLKTLLAFNVVLLLPLLAFTVGVQAAFPPEPLGSVPAFTGLELLTGGVRAWWGGAGGVGGVGRPPVPASPGETLIPGLCCDSGGAAVSSPWGPDVSGAWEAPGRPRPFACLCCPCCPCPGPSRLCLSAHPPPRAPALPLSLEA